MLKDLNKGINIMMRIIEDIKIEPNRNSGGEKHNVVHFKFIG